MNFPKNPEDYRDIPDERVRQLAKATDEIVIRIFDEIAAHEGLTDPERDVMYTMIGPKAYVMSMVELISIGSTAQEAADGLDAIIQDLLRQIGNLK